MWRKILKYRELVKKFYKVEIRNGKKVLFWYDKWLFFGCLKELLGNGGCMGMGIIMNVKVEDCIYYRRKNYRVVIFNRIEVEIEKFKENRNVEEDDIYLWRSGNDKYRRKFLIIEIW